MGSREQILAAVQQYQPAHAELPVISRAAGPEDMPAQYIASITAIGGVVHEVLGWEEIVAMIKEKYSADRIISACPEITEWPAAGPELDPHTLEDVELAIIPSAIAVAENGAVWLPESVLPQRALPFITQHLAVVVRRSAIVATMHDAYGTIGDDSFGYGVFIAGPSKTADIEQSLVLGAHGPKTMTVFILNA